MALSARRIPTLEFTDSAMAQINRLCERLGITDPRDLIAKSLKALEVISEAAGEKDDEVVIEGKSGKGKRVTLRIRN